MSATRRIHARWLRGGASLAIVLLLHVAILGPLGTRLSAETLGNPAFAGAKTAGVGQPPRSFALLQVRAVAPPDGRPQPVADAAARLPSVASIAPVGLVASIAPVGLVASALSVGTPIADPSPLGRSAHFFGTQEVDVPAQPETDWAIDIAALDSLSTSRVVFTAYIGSDGRVLRCIVTEPARLSDDTRRTLAERLERTRMRPARIGGEAVASRRHVELYSEGGL